MWAAARSQASSHIRSGAAKMSARDAALLLSLSAAQPSAPPHQPHQAQQAFQAAAAAGSAGGSLHGGGALGGGGMSGGHGGGSHFSAQQRCTSRGSISSEQLQAMGLGGGPGSGMGAWEDEAASDMLPVPGPLFAFGRHAAPPSVFGSEAHAGEQHAAFATLAGAPVQAAGHPLFQNAHHGAAAAYQRASLPTGLPAGVLAPVQGHPPRLPHGHQQQQQQWHNAAPVCDAPPPVHLALVRPFLCFLCTGFQGFFPLDICIHSALLAGTQQAERRTWVVLVQQRPTPRLYFLKFAWVRVKRR